jgi:membrane protein
MKISFLRQYIDTFTDRSVQFHSAALAFYMVVALPAFVIFFVSVAGLVIAPEILKAWLGTSGIAGVVHFEQVRSQVVQFSSITAIMSALLMMWSGSAMFHRIQQGLRAMWLIRLDVGKGLHRFIATKLLAIIIALLFVVGIMALFFFTQIVALFIGTLTDMIPWLVTALPIAQMIQYVLVTIVVMIVYGLFGDSRVSWQLLVPSSLVVAAVYLSLQLGFQSYLKNLAAVNWYGAAGSVIVLLLLLYIMGIIFYAGAIWMYVVADRHHTYYIRPRSYAHQTDDPDHGVLHRVWRWMYNKL